MEVTRWRKAARSEGLDNCVEVTPDAVRDSKSPGAVLRVNLVALVSTVKHGKLDR